MGDGDGLEKEGGKNRKNGNKSKMQRGYTGTNENGIETKEERKRVMEEWIRETSKSWKKAVKKGHLQFGHEIKKNLNAWSKESMVRMKGTLRAVSRVHITILKGIRKEKEEEEEGEEKKKRKEENWRGNGRA